MNVLKKTIITEYQGTKITIDYLNLVTTGIMVILSILLIGYGEYEAALAVLMLSILPYVHELGHYFMARRIGMHVSELNFLGDGTDAKVEGTLTHKETRDIALAGELVTGVIFWITFAAIFSLAWQLQTPFIYLTAGIPAIWILSWLHPQSDMLVACKAHHFYNKQIKESQKEGEYKIGSQ